LDGQWLTTILSSLIGVVDNTHSQWNWVVGTIPILSFVLVVVYVDHVVLHKVVKQQYLVG
jgi:hypothetical protein